MSAPTDKPDLVLEIALAIVAADKQSQEAERKQMAAKRDGNGMEANYYEHGQQDANNAYYGLKDALPFIEANSFSAAMVQLSEAVSLVEWLADICDEGERKEAERLRTALHRLITSALRAIERETGQSLAQLGLETLRATHRDPWEDPAERIAIVRETWAS